MKQTLSPEEYEEIAARLEPDHQEYDRSYKGMIGRKWGGRQPIQTLYGGAHLFRRDTAARMGRLALAALEKHAPDARGFGEAFGVAPVLAEELLEKVKAKLEREPVEDQRLDFEDGYGQRPEAEEDGHAVAAAKEMAAGMEAGSLARGVGIRIKALTQASQQRALRTLDLFLTALEGRLPSGFVVTLPKVCYAEQVEALADALEQLEGGLGIEAGSVKVEIMVETPQALLDAQGRCPLRRMVDAGRGRCVAAHFGAYDFTAACGVTSADQRLDHPLCDAARQTMQVALAGSGVRLSEGAMNVLPIGERETVWQAWQLHAGLIRRALSNGFYQGWDLHPAQLPARYAATYEFFCAGQKSAGERLKNFVEQAARATRVGGVFDDAATGEGLVNFFERAVGCGALSEKEAKEATGMGMEELKRGLGKGKNS